MSSPNHDNANEAKPVVVKKYANRRLYNTATSSYVTLDDLAKLIKEGGDFVDSLRGQARVNGIADIDRVGAGPSVESGVAANRVDINGVRFGAGLDGGRYLVRGRLAQHG